MAKYVFILGKNPALSNAEIEAVFSNTKIEARNTYTILDGVIGTCEDLLRRLGGTIKIGEILSIVFNAETIANELLKQKEGKIVFGISNYSVKTLQHESMKIIGLEIKRFLQKEGRRARFVVSQEKVLSSVIVKKEKCAEFIILDEGMVAKTCCVQEFEEYGFRDYGRPARDAKTGMLPPKLAKIMINLAQAKPDDILLDPFCGSGTILQEAIFMGYKNIIGSDASPKAIEDTRKNIDWLFKSFPSPAHRLRFAPLEALSLQGGEGFISSPSPQWGEGGGGGEIYKLFQSDVRDIFSRVKSVDAIITEPYLGPALTGRESRKKIQSIVDELKNLYIDAFREFAKILKPAGRIVMVFPVFIHHTGEIFTYSFMRKDIEKLGFHKLRAQDLIYARSHQRVAREIVMIERI